jgi:uncharacterized damage-inducible protein DinB
MLKRLTLACAVAAASASPSGAQTKSQMIADWTRERETVLAYVDAMPDSAMTFHPTPGVRTFGEQIIHIVATNLDVAARTLRGQSAAPFPYDTATTPRQKAALRDYADRSFAYVLESLRAATPAMLSKSITLPDYENNTQSAARWMEMSREHTVWTLGQTVPYLRLNGVTPPTYKIPF